MSEPLVDLDVLPQFPGGAAAFQKYLGGKLIYPAAAKKSNTQGRVYMSFVVEKDGSLSNLRVLDFAQYPVDFELSLEVLRVFKNCPEFIPGTKAGKPVRTRLTQPITF